MILKDPRRSILANLLFALLMLPLAATGQDCDTAGSNGALAVCSINAPIALINSLGDSPDAGGTWTGPNGPHSGTFDPSVDAAGIYTYTITNTAPCLNSSATVTVTLNQMPDAGSNGSITVCGNAPAFDLFDHLEGTPSAGGAWTGPGGAPVPAIYTPGTSVPGIYTYTLLGQPPCLAATATVTVSQVAPPSAGSNASITICSSQAPFQLISQLNGTPSAGGTWIGPNGPHGATFDPATDPGGVYTYTVTGTAPCANASATLTITRRVAPNAGSNASITVCSTDASFSLLDELNGAPDVGGTWTAPGGAPHSGMFQPGTSAAGTYTYTVTGQLPCTPATATITVTVSIAPDAGTGGSVIRCSNDAAFSMFAQLGGSPDAGGSWTGPGGGAHAAMFDPAIDPPGTYTYTVTGATGCSNATAALNIALVTAPNAGANGDTLICSNASQFPLIDVIDGTPALNGTWTAPGGGGTTGNFTPGISVAGIYTYTVAGQAPCANAQANATVNIQAAPNAGTNGSITVCSSAGPVNLLDQLGGAPAAGGSWTGPNGSAHNGTYLPGTQPGGTYTYTVAGTAPCAPATATVQVIRVIAPRAGTDGTITVCNTNGPFQMISVLGGSPDGGGTWRNASNTIVPGTFTPGTTPAGTYSYVVAGTAPCANDTSFVTINVNEAPDAGLNASIQACSNDASFDLFTALGGTPDAGGTWAGPGGQAFNGNFIPASATSGIYSYTVTGLAPCLNATAVVAATVNLRPNAGSDATITRCSTEPPVDLLSIIGPADANGNWSGPSPIVGGVLDPSTNAAGVYTYTVNGSGACEAESVQVTAVINAAPDAGSGGSITVCQGDQVIALHDVLAGNPDQNGSWSDDDGTNQLSGDLFSTNGIAIGTYSFTYTVPGIGVCASDQSVVDVIIVSALNAGSNGSINACQTNTQVDLFSGLNGSPQAGGTWADMNGTGAQSGQFFNASFVPPGSYTFQYQLTGSVSCATSTASVTVNVTQAPNAGMNGQAVLCENGASVPLFTYLGGSPTAGGTWTRNSETVPATYNPVVHPPGSYVYTVSGSGPCPNAQATVLVSEVAAPIAGTGGQIPVCCSDGAFNMTQLLGGSPQPGTWSFNGTPHSADFVPCLDEPGVYVYTVPGQPPCAAATATFTISVTQPAEAGNNASMMVCSDDAPVVLLSQLQGATFGGTWIAPDSSSHSASFVYVPGNSPAGQFTYSIPPAGPCPADAANLSIFENEAANAGGDVSVTLCSNGPSVDLFTLLPGEPDPTGTWTGPGSTPSNGVFVPGTSTPGAYVYVVEGAPPCITDSATVTVSIENAPNAGGSNAITVCSDATAFSMVQMLTGSPQLGGTWSGPLPATTPVDGIFFPATSAPGEYVYTVGGSAVCAPATASLQITVNAAPNAGNNASLSVCSTGGSVNLFTLLGPDAQPGGTWSIQGSGSPFSGTFVPSTNTTGVYVYTVTGVAPCSNDVALVSVTLNQAPNAGFNGLVTICANSGPFNLLDHLNGSPQANGNWTGPNGPHSGIFIPGSDTGGIYTYTVNGAAPCTNATAQVTVIQNEQPNAGQNGVAQICSNQPPFQLIDHLSGSPDEGGNWSAPNGSAFSGTFVPGTSTGGLYTYIIPAQAPCINDTARVTVIQSTAPNAGCNAVVQICSSAAPQPLLNLLGCSPAANGTWTLGVNGPAHGPIFDPSVDASGTYVYTVAGSAPCTNAVAQVQITKVNAPNAGSNGSISACLDDATIPLFSALGGSASPGGTWTNLNSAGTITNGVLNATGVAAGTYQYRYIVTGTGPCPSDTAFVVVQLSSALDAGEDASVNVCETQLLDLFTALGGTPQAGGAWQDVDGSGALIGNVFNANQVTEGSTWRFDYVLPASSQCAGDVARVTVTVVEGPNAGCAGQVAVCSSGTPVQLGNSLGCSPDAGGEWFGPSGTAHSGSFDPATDAAGVYEYVVPSVGNCPADSTTVTVTIQQAPNAGEDASISICSTDDAIVLFDLLGPSAQSGGSWFHVTGNIPHSGIYDPAANTPGTYRYTISATLPCANDFAFVEVIEPEAPNAGCNASLNICSTLPPIQLINYLGCEPSPGGTWVGPDGNEHGEFFDPAGDAPGEYIYTLAGEEPCADASASLIVAVTLGDHPGTNAIVDACISQTAIDLFEALGPLADPGGSWEDLDGSNALTGSSFDPSIAGIGQWVFQYSFPSNGPCPETSSTVTVNVSAGANAGADSSVVVCGALTGFDLFSALGGDPEAGGTWEDLTGSGALIDGTFNASLLEPGTTVQFGYEIVDPGCGPVSAVVSATVSEYLDPGVSDTIQVCITSGPVDLVDALGGTPDPGGIWTGPNLAEHSGTFTPGVDQPGAYFYNMPPTPECGALSSFVLVGLIELANAGEDASIVACDTISSLPLISGLGGSPQSGGTWVAVDPEVGDALLNGMLNAQLLPIGTYQFTYTIDAGECGTDIANLEVQVIEGPQPGEVVRICDERSRTYVITFPIVSGDPATYAVSGVEGSISGAPDYVFTSVPIPANLDFEVHVSDASGCTSVPLIGTSPCDFEEDIFIPETFSPNDDGINDTFMIPGIEGFPDNRIVIFNRWGGKVYEAGAYDNNTVVWDGTSTSALIGGKVPAGTYFYVLELNNGTDPYTGYIYLNR